MIIRNKWDCLYKISRTITSNTITKSNIIFHILFFHTLKTSKILPVDEAVILTIHCINSQLYTHTFYCSYFFFLWRILTLTNTYFTLYDYCLYKMRDLDTNMHRRKIMWSHREKQANVDFGTRKLSPVGYSKMWEVRHKLKKKLLSRNKTKQNNNKPLKTKRPRTWIFGKFTAHPYCKNVWMAWLIC